MSFVYRDSRTDRPRTLRRLRRRFVTMYVCGPTVYAPSHVGHGRTYLAFDLVRRYLRESGIPTRHVMNITDVEDKIEERARELGLTPLALARREEHRFFRDLDALHVLRPSYAPRASDWVAGMVRVGRQLERTGNLERRGGSWYYSPPPGHAKLNFPMAEDISRHAVREPRTKDGNGGPDPRDFMIWKGQDAPGPTWTSPWGRGVPGWHLECYAMAQHYLGIPVDFQGGGMDLIFPHHYAQNEIALALQGTPFARGFMHLGFVRDGGAKMSKSIGNLVALGPATREYGPSALRWYLLGSPYADPVDWTEREAAESRSTFVELRRRVRRSVTPGGSGSVSAGSAVRLADKVEAAIGRNLDIPHAFELLRLWADELGRRPQPRASAGERPAVRDAYARIERLTGLHLLSGR